jgi:type IV pilus assembly protein PilM
VNIFQSLFSSKRQSVGIELTPERVNLARIRKQGQKLKLETRSSVELPEGAFQEGQILDSPAVAEAIQEGLADSRIKVKYATTAIPGRAITRVIPVPSEKNEEELRGMVRI